MRGARRLGPTEADLGFNVVLWRAIDVVRLVGAGYAVVAFLTRPEPYQRPALAVATLAVMAVWSVLVAVYRRRPGWLIVTDLGLAALAVLMTGVVDTRVNAAEYNTLPLIWPTAAVLSWAVWRGWLTGVLAALVIGAVDLVVVEPVTRRTMHNVVLLVVAAGTVGFAARLYARTREQAARAIQVAAAARERERLARDIHDSVLQVLAFVQRRGLEIGGPSAELGRLAGEQEVLLRSLIGGRTAPRPAHPAESADLTTVLRRHWGTSAQVSGPAEPVLLPAEDADALDRAVGACLQNVVAHAGPGAKAWVLVEDEPDQVTVTVRDDGVGIRDGRLEQAQAQGRLGVSSSIRGRVEERGGQVSFWSAPGRGTEVELRLPRLG